MPEPTPSPSETAIAPPNSTTNPRTPSFATKPTVFHNPTNPTEPKLWYPNLPGGPSMRTIILCLIAAASHAATTVYQASLDQLTVVHGTAAADADIHHTAPKSLRIEPGGQYPDAQVRSAPVSLTVG